MFAKLLKYEWKSTSAILGILSLCALGAGVVGAGVIRLIVYCSNQMDSGNSAVAILMVLSALLLIGLYLGLMAYAAGSQIMLYYRFYKSRFTDEGYLTFTLPVTAGQVFWSSFLVILGWTLISSVVMTVSIAAILLLGTVGTEAQLSMESLKQTMQIYKILFEQASVELTVAGVVSVVSLLANIVYYMTAITVGSIIARKHKLLAAIGVYIGASLVMSMVIGTLSVFPVILQAENAIVFVQVMEVIFTVAMAAGACALNIHLMKNKLNLP